MTLPGMAAFLGRNGLGFVGFELDDAVVTSYQKRFPDDPGAVNLANWEKFEAENPGMFAAMYIFWVQKA